MFQPAELHPEHNILIRKLRSISPVTENELHCIATLPFSMRTVGADQDIVREGDRPSECCHRRGLRVPEMAEQMIPAGAAAAHFAPTFADIQAAIEAIDRAIKDEEGLPADYALEGAEETIDHESASVAANGSNVVDVDFDKS